MNYTVEGDLIRLQFDPVQMKSGVSFSNVDGLEYYLPNKKMTVTAEARNAHKSFETTKNIKRRWEEFFRSLAEENDVDLDKNKIIYTYQLSSQGLRWIYDIHKI